MKYVYLILTILIFHTSYGQDSALFNNIWYVRTVQLDDMTDIHHVSEIDPPIAPYLDISEDFSFVGIGACNNFEGVYSFYPPQDLMATDFAATTDDCGVQAHTRFEEDYFWFISHEFWFEISQNGTVLTFETPLGGTVVFMNYPLSTTDFYRDAFILYPNPVNDVLVLHSQTEIGNATIKVFNIEGRLLSTQNARFENQVSIDVSNLSGGIYFLKVEDESGNRAIKKFLKQ